MASDAFNTRKLAWWPNEARWMISSWNIVIMGLNFKNPLMWPLILRKVSGKLLKYPENGQGSPTSVTGCGFDRVVSLCWDKRVILCTYRRSRGCTGALLLQTMAREYDHLFKLLIIGDSGKSSTRVPTHAHSRALLFMYTAYSDFRCGHDVGTQHMIYELKQGYLGINSSESSHLYEVWIGYNYRVTDQRSTPANSCTRVVKRDSFLRGA